MAGKRWRRWRRYSKKPPTPNRSDVQLYNLPVATLKAQLDERLASYGRLGECVRASLEAKRDWHRQAMAEFEERRAVWGKLASENLRINQEIAAVIRADKDQQGLLARLFSDKPSPAAAARVEELRKSFVEPGPAPTPPAPFESSLTAEEKQLAEHLHYIEVWLRPALAKAEKREAKGRKARERQEREAARRALLEAAGAAHIGETRDLADRVRKDLAGQEAIFAGCPYCFGPLGKEPHADHIFPVSRGGLSTLDNMVLICSACNLKKSDSTLREFIKTCGLDRERIEAALERLGKRF